MHPAVRLMLRDRAQRQAAARSLAAQGIHGDSILAHITPAEALLLKAQGGAGTRNPRTGLLQFYGGTGGADEGGPSALGGSGHAATQGNPRSGSGGYGNATGDRGSGLGAGGGHSGSNYTSQQFGNPAPQIVYVQQPAAPTSNMPGPPVATAPMISDTATTDLTGGRFGALPSWATTPYQIGTAPTSYPTPGVNTSLGAPGTAAPGGLGGLGGMPASTPPGAAPAKPQPAGTLTNPQGQMTNLAGQVLPYQPNAVSIARNIAPNASNAAVAQLLAAAGITPKAAAHPAGPTPVSPLQQSALAALGMHPAAAQAQPRVPTGIAGPMASPVGASPVGASPAGGLGGLGGIAAKPATSQPQPVRAKPASQPQSALAALTGSGTPKKTAAPTAVKKPAGKTNR